MTAKKRLKAFENSSQVAPKSLTCDCGAPNIIFVGKFKKKNHFNQSLIKFDCSRKECSLLSKCIEIAIIELNIFIQKY